MAEQESALVESREELMVSPCGKGNPTLRTAHLLKPLVTSNAEPNSLLPSLRSVFGNKDRPLFVNFLGWRCPQRRWKEWVGKMAALHESTWRKAGIFEAIMNSTYKIFRNDDLILKVVEKWCPETNSFLFPWGEATITLEDMMVSAGYSVLGSPVFNPLEKEELKRVEEKLKKARRQILGGTAKKARQYLWLMYFMNSGSEIEHEALLALWLSRFVLPTCFDVISECVFPIVVHLARGTRIALAPAVLADIYRDLSFLKEKMFALDTLKAEKTTRDKDDDALAFAILSPFQLVQVWVWERFVELRPKPNLIKKGEPRLGLWDCRQCKVENVKLILDSAGESFLWRPYCKTMQNWDFPKFYCEKEMWVSANLGLDEEFLSFILCLRVSELVGLQCIEQYLPHRVAMQFGLDQDIPDYVGRSNKSPEIAWNCYNRSMTDVKCYLPARPFEADVTSRYLDWWSSAALVPEQASMDVLQQQKHSASLGARRSREMKSDPFSSSFKITPKRKGKKKMVNCMSSFKIARKKKTEGSKLSSKVSQETRKGNTVLSFKEITEILDEGESFEITPKSSKGHDEADGACISPSPFGFCQKGKDCTVLGKAVKQSMISANSPKIKMRDTDASDSIGFNVKLEDSLESIKEEKAGKGSTRENDSSMEISTPSLKGKTKENEACSAHESASEKPCQNLKRKSQQCDMIGSPNCCSKLVKTLPLTFVMAKELNNSLVPPGFTAKCSGVTTRNSSPEDRLTAAAMLKSGDMHNDTKKYGFGGGQNLAGQSQSESHSVAETNTAKILELETSLVDVQADAVGNRLSSDIVDASAPSNSHPFLGLESRASKMLDTTAQSMEKVRHDETVKDRLDADHDSLLGHSPSSSIPGTTGYEAPKILQPLSITEKVMLSDGLKGIPEKDVEHENETAEGSPVCNMANTNENKNGSGNCSYAEPWLKLEGRIATLEKIIAAKKTTNSYPYTLAT